MKVDKQNVGKVICIAYSVVFTLCLFCLFSVMCYIFSPVVKNVYAELQNYPEELYIEYENEATKLIEDPSYVPKCKYKTELNSENGTGTMTVWVGDFYNKDFSSTSYVIARAKGYGTENQTVTFTRKIANREESLKEARHYKILIIAALILIPIAIIVLAVHLIKCSLKKDYIGVFYPIFALLIIALVFKALASA